MTVQIKCGNSSQMATFVLAVAQTHNKCLYLLVSHRTPGPGAQCFITVVFHNESSETSPRGADYLCPDCLQDQGEISPHSPLAPLHPALSWAPLTLLSKHITQGSQKLQCWKKGCYQYSTVIETISTQCHLIYDSFTTMYKHKSAPSFITFETMSKSTGL